jgi:hypothetical protein
MSDATDAANTASLDDAMAAEDYDEADSSTKSEDRDEPAAELNVTEENVIRAVRELGIEYQDLDSTAMRFERKKARLEDELFLSPQRIIPRASIPELAQQLGSEIIDHPTTRGFMIPAVGYSELVLRGYGRLPVQYTLERILGLVSDMEGCPHQSQDKRLPAIPFRSRLTRAYELVDKRLHVASPSGFPCMEISNASPLGMLFYGRIVYSSEANFTPTVKIDFGKSIDGKLIIKATEDLVRSLLYELDVRNGIVVGTLTRPLPREARARARRRSPTTERVRYPRVRIQYEVSDLFNFASQADDNPPLAFLSYYQTLEYFIPAAVRQSALKRIRQELRDPMFDEGSDNCLLRIVSATERSVNIPEASQLRTLVDEYVRKDRLEEFFREEWGNHFTRKGPVQGVEAINLSNTSSLGDQVADRIYQIRNRIVHAKDDPRYQDARVLLPRSQEAEALRPDVELVRLLAMEAILIGQGS